MKPYWIAKGFKFFLFFLIFLALMGFATMWLWNNLLVTIFTWPLITYWQALGIMLLARLIFGFGFGHRGGWHSGYSGHHHYWKSRMADKWKNMTPDERERLRSEWKKRCGRWYDKDEDFDKKEEQEGAQKL